MDCPKSCDTEEIAVLPADPLVEILSLVPVKSVCRFKCVSKAWRDLIADPHHRKNLPQTLQGFFFMFDQEHCESDSCGYDCGSDDGDGRDSSADGSVGEELPCQRYGFVDVLGKSVRPVDFSFLTELGNVEKSMLLHCCNGLLLFVVDCNSDISDSYVVCNPATKQYVPVPSNPYAHCNTWNQIVFGSMMTYLLFDPGVSSHFHVVQFWQTSNLHISVYMYSSETHAWSDNRCDWDSCYQSITPNSPNTYVNAMLHLILESGNNQLAAVDVEGNIQKIFPLPCRAQADWTFFDYVGQSKGCLHYICHEQQKGSGCRERSWYGLLVWVLQDNDRQQWVLKDTVNFLKLFGKSNCHLYSEYNVVRIHPDRSLVLLVQHWDRKLIHITWIVRKCVISALLDMAISASLHMFPTSQSWCLKVSREIVACGLT